MTQTLATTSSLRGRVARKKSDDYVSSIIERREKNASLTHEGKVRKMALVLQDEVNGIKRLGVGMVGPIQLKLRYQGITRNVLVEDPVTPGTPVEYDVWDDLGQAYIMSGTEGEVRVTPFEGKRVPVRFFRIASRPRSARRTCSTCASTRSSRLRTRPSRRSSSRRTPGSWCCSRRR
jgi:hypothetical protein